MYDYNNPYGYANPYMNRVANNQVQTSGFITIPSERDARNYPVAYGNSVSFKDENLPYVYTKTAISQMELPIFKKYRLVEETSEMPVNPVSNDKSMNLSDYVTKAEFDRFLKEFDALKKALGEGDNT